MKEKEPKLTVERQRLYADIRSMATMPVDALDVIEVRRPKESTPSPRVEVREHAAHEARRTLLAPELRRHADKEEGEGILKPKRKEKKGIVSELPRDTFDMAKDALWSDKKVDQLFGVMALELDEHTKDRPLSEWRPMQRALEYSDWEDFSEQLAKETKKLQAGKATQEEVDRSYNMRLAVMGIKKELAEGLSQRKDKEVVLDGKKEKVSDLQIVTDGQAREAYFKKIDGLDATTIETKEIKEAFDSLIERTKPESAALRPVELDALRQEWHKLEEKFRDSNDTHGLQALSIAREKVADLRKKKAPVGRREETPKAVRKTSSVHAESSELPVDEPKSARELSFSESQSRVAQEIWRSGGTMEEMVQKAVEKGISRENAIGLFRLDKQETAAQVEQRTNREIAELAALRNDDERAEYLSAKVRKDQRETGKTRLQAIDELHEDHRDFIGGSQAEKEAQEALIRTELGKAQVEAMIEWQKEKEERMESLVDRRKKDGSLDEGVKSRLKKETWDDYDWTTEERDDFINSLQKDYGVEDKDKAFAVATTLLLSGRSAEQAKDFVKEHKDRNGQFAAFEFVKNFQHDEDVWEAFGMGDKFEDFNRNEYETSEVKDIENLGWQLNFIYGNAGFAEDGEHPAWERRVLTVDGQGRKVAKKDGQWYAVNSQEEIIDKKPVDRVKFQLHEVANKGNIILAMRKRVNWEQYKDENGKWNVFQLKLPDKRGFVQVSIESMLDAKDTAFSGSKEEAVPKWLLAEMAEKHGIEDKERLTNKTVKENYKDVAEVIEMEGYFVTMIRQMHLSYIENYTNEEELAKNLNALLSKSHLTRDMWGERPLWSFMAQFAANYTSLDKMDGILGGTIIDNYLGYYYLSDFEMLEEQFGEKREDGTYDTSKVKLFNFNGLRQIRNSRVDNVANENNELGQSKYAPMKYDSYFDFGYKYKKDASGRIVDSQGNRYHQHKDGSVRVGENAESRVIIRANGDIVDKEAARKILGQVKDEKTGKPVWFDKKEFNGLFTVEADQGGVRFEPILDEDGKEVKDNEGNKLWQMRTELPRKNGDKFANFINYFQNFGPDPKKRHIVEKAISDAAASAGKEKLNPINSDYANLIATNLVRFTGAAARNDAPLEGHKQMYDTLGRFIHFRASRMKYIIDEKGNDQGKAGKFGNPETIGTFGSLVTEPMLAIVSVAKNKEGNWRKPILEVFHDLSRARREVGKATTKESKEVAMEKYRDTAVNELLFDEQSERHFFDNQLERAVRISKKIKGAEEIKLNDFGSWSPEVGFTFKQKEFQEAMTGFMQDLRYDVKSYGMGVQYHMHARFWDYDGGEWDPVAKRYKGQWRTMSLAESRYNRQAYDHPDFKTNGKIDPWKIEKEQHLLYKRVFSEWFVGELVHSRKMDKMSTGPRHDMAWYRNVLNALEKIPGDFRVSNKDMWNNEVTKPFLTKDLMKKIKKESHTSWGYLYGLAVLKGLFYGKPSKKEEAVWSAVLESIFAIPKSAFTLRA